MTDIILTKQQIRAVEMIKKNKTGVIFGGPGTGKTTVTRQIIDWAQSKDLMILQAAPTGKAAKRMMSSTDFYASTIHSMLGCMFEKNKFVFIHNKLNPLNADLIIIDEISMITVDLMARVLEAIDPQKTKLLLIGDADQLPSVGAGAVLRDILSSGVIPHTELDIIHRNSGEIVAACHKIKNGQIYTPYRKLNLSAENLINLIHIECFSPEQTLLGVQKLMCEVIPDKYSFNPVDDIQVISPVNSKGLLSCDSINATLRDILNPVPKVTSSTKLKLNDDDHNHQFRSGDKVINTKNMKAATTDGDEVVIVNGDIGKVKSINTKTITILFSDPDREVTLLKTEQSLLHAYAITCHRFQGSEAPVIIIPICNQFNYFLSNAWIYTAISRAKVICVTIGTFGTVERAIHNRMPNNRVTMLRERLVDADEKMIEKEFAEI